MLKQLMCVECGAIRDSFTILKKETRETNEGLTHLLRLSFALHEKQSLLKKLDRLESEL